LRTDWHVVSATEELSSRNGSAILTVVKNLASAAKRRGHGGYIIGAHNPKNDLDNVWELLTPRPWTVNHRMPRRLDNAAKYLVGRSPNTPVVERIDNHQPTHIYCHNQPWLVRSVREQYPEAKIFLYVHNKIMQGARRSTIRSIIEACNGVLCVSDFIRTELGTRAGMTSEEIQKTIKVHMNGVDSTPYLKAEGTKGEQPFDVVYVGRIIPEKGVHILAEALARISISRNITVLVVGGHTFLPGAESAYERHVKSLLMRDGIAATFTGPVPPTNIPTLINSAKLHVVPSIWDEPCALVLLEGLASQACLIGTTTGGTPEIAANTRLETVAPGDALRLQETILMYMDSDEKRHSDSSTQRQWAHKMSWDHVYEQILMNDE
jgi:glycosyltransferase involved in cell wall biosynthesis